MTTATTQLTQHLAHLSDTLKQTQSLITRLSKLTFTPGSEPLDDESGSARVELAQDIHDSLKQLDEELELLRSEVEDLTNSTAARRNGERDRERDQLSAGVERVSEDLRQARAGFRAAQLSAKRAAEAAKAKERELVFKDLTAAPVSAEKSEREAGDLFAARAPRRHKQQLSKDEVVVNASTDVTAALRRTHDLLSTELSRSRFAQETFEQSTEALRDLGEKYSDLNTILANSRGLLSTLLRSQKSDTWYLETAFYILLTTLIWLVFRRLLFGPFIKLPLFLWRFIAFTLNWFVLKPLFLLLTLVGVIRSEPVPLRSQADTVSTKRPPLIIQPSANDPVPRFSMSGQGVGVPAGAGGAGAKVGKDGRLQGQMSEQIGQMAEKSTQAAQGQAGDEAAKEPVRRGDGTILQDRGDIPKNPKKKTFDVGADDPSQQRRKRDEL